MLNVYIDQVSIKNKPICVVGVQSTLSISTFPKQTLFGKLQKVHNEVSETYIKFEEVLLLLWGNLVICPEGQVMDFNTLSQIHSLQKPKHDFNTWLSTLKKSETPKIIMTVSLFRKWCEFKTTGEQIKTHLITALCAAFSTSHATWTYIAILISNKQWNTVKFS